MEAFPKYQSSENSARYNITGMKVGFLYVPSPSWEKVRMRAIKGFLVFLPVKVLVATTVDESEERSDETTEAVQPRPRYPDCLRWRSRP